MCGTSKRISLNCPWDQLAAWWTIRKTSTRKRLEWNGLSFIHCTKTSRWKLYSQKKITQSNDKFNVYRFGSYGSDIALIEIDGNVDLNSFFLPACIDWNLDDITSHLSHTNLGYVAGMGVSEDNLFSDQLKVTSLPVVEDNECMERQQPDFRKYLTFTTFCAGWKNGTGVCNGDSGSGLIFPTKDLWYLQVTFLACLAYELIYHWQ